jgi:hypothetical protein
LNRQEESPQPAGPGPIAGLHRVLGTFDIVLLNVAAIISFRWLAVAAQVGPSSLTLWVLGLLVPPTDSVSPWLFGLKVVGGCIVMIAVGLIFYARGRRAATILAADRSGEVSRDG